MNDLIVHKLSKEFDTLELYSLSDLHVGERGCDIKAFREFIKMIESQPNRYIVYNGDNMNNALKTSVSDIYSENMNPRQQKEFLIKELFPIKDKILAFVEGNHEGRSVKDTGQSIVEEIATRLGHQDLYRADAAFINVTFGNCGSLKQSRSYELVVLHGSGGGKGLGGSLSNLDKFAGSIIADVYIMGHVHQKIAGKKPVILFDTRHGKLITKERLYCISSSWVEYGGYALRNMYSPGAKGAIPIILHSKEKRADAVV